LFLFVAVLQKPCQKIITEILIAGIHIKNDGIMTSPVQHSLFRLQKINLQKNFTDYQS